MKLVWAKLLSELKKLTHGSVGWKSIPFTRSERANSCLCNIYRQQSLQLWMFTCEIISLYVLRADLQLYETFYRAYLDVEPHVVWGMRRVFVWCGVGPVTAIGDFASRSNSPMIGRSDPRGKLLIGGIKKGLRWRRAWGSALHSGTAMYVSTRDSRLGSPPSSRSIRYTNVLQIHLHWRKLYGLLCEIGEM